MTFDPELYLRLLGERMVVGDHRGLIGRRIEDLGEAARALISFGLVDRETAWQVLDAYAAALGMAGLRPAAAGSGYEHAPGTTGAAPETGQLPRRRVFVTDAAFESRHGLGRCRLHWIILTDARVTICLTATAASPSALSAPPRVELTTPDGQRIEAVFSGIPEPGLGGDFEADASVGLDAGWLLVDGTRVELEPAPVTVDIAVQQRPAAGSAVAFVWQLLDDVTDRRGWPNTGASAVNALSAAGLIGSDDPQVAAIEWARNLVPPPPVWAERLQPPPAIAAPPTGVPPEWLSLARSRRAAFTGRSRTVAVGAVTPVFDDLCVSVDLLSFSSTGLVLKAEIAGLRLHARVDLQHRPVAFWARDDRDNHYLGRRESWSQDPGTAVGHGTVAFPAIDPAATRLTITVSTKTAHASIGVPL